MEEKELYTADIRPELIRQGILIQGLDRRVQLLEAAVANSSELKTTLARLEERLAHQEARLDEQINALERKMDQWRNLIWGLVLLLISQLVIAGFELLKR